jgi:hypothetical protein
VAVGSLRWLSTQVRWALMGTTLGTCGNGHGRERKCDAVWARARHGARMVQDCGRGRESADTICARTLNGCAKWRARMVKADKWAHARSAALIEHVQNFVITYNRFIL